MSMGPKFLRLDFYYIQNLTVKISNDRHFALYRVEEDYQLNGKPFVLVEIV